MSASRGNRIMAWMKVKDIGEFGLIDRLARLVQDAGQCPDAGGFRLRLGIGDDAAAWDPGQGIEVCTTDTMVQGVHFTEETIPWDDVGWKVMVANLSDIAAMGGQPLYAVVTLGLPMETPVAHVDALYGGMLEACSRYTVAIVGGDVVASPVPFVTVALTGVCACEPLVRFAAVAGDTVAVTGSLGGSAAGLEVLQGRLPVAEEAQKQLFQAHRRPVPRLNEGQLLARRGIRCAMDISDGLVDDLAKLCRTSEVAAQVDADAVPVHPALRDALPDGYRRFALHGGEDYALLFTGPPATVEEVLREIPSDSAAIGRIIRGKPGDVAVVDTSGRELTTLSAGWDHFRSP